MRDETQRATGMPVAPEVAALLRAAQRVGDTGPVAEQLALDAFRAARDEGAHAPVSALRAFTAEVDVRPAIEIPDYS
ncbi:hypothetical protein ACWD7T_34310, partial [Streptomyces sp. 900116325]